MAADRAPFVEQIDAVITDYPGCTVGGLVSSIILLSIRNEYSTGLQKRMQYFAWNAGLKTGFYRV